MSVKRATKRFCGAVCRTMHWQHLFPEKKNKNNRNYKARLKQRENEAAELPDEPESLTVPW
jgi:Fe-S-cluster containining protein